MQESFADIAKRLLDFCGRITELPRTVLSSEESVRFEYRLMQLENYAGKIALFGIFLQDFVRLSQPDMVYWIEKRIYKGRTLLSLHRTPVSIKRIMTDTVHERYAGVCYTSATLANGNGDFSYFLDRIGLLGLPQGSYHCRQLPTEFDYKNRVLLAVNDTFPEKPNMDFADRFARFAKDFVMISRGRVFFLFTSWNLLCECYDKTMTLLSEEWQSTCLRQGDLDRMRLLDAFRSMPQAILFGTNSFWEGVDVKGEGLIAVVIVRLPFQAPDDPLVQARCETIEDAGGSSFWEYTVPNAVIRFRQGCGRLMRARDDYGVIVVLDPRIAKKSYGRVFMRSLPVCTHCIGDDKQILGSVENFLARFEEYDVCE